MKKITYLLIICVAALSFATCGHNNEPENENPAGDTIVGGGGYETYPKTILGSWKIDSCLLVSITTQTTTDLTTTSYQGKHIESFNDKGSHPVFEDAMLINHTNYRFEKDTMIFFDDYNTFADRYVITTLTDSKLEYKLLGEGYYTSYYFSRYTDYSEEFVGTWSVDRIEPAVEDTEFTTGTTVEFTDNGSMSVLEAGDEAERFFFIAGDDLNLENKIFHITQCDDHTMVMERNIEGTTVHYYFSR